MASVSELARLYEVVFGEPPSIASTKVLLRMEELLGLTQDDPLARMLILQLRVADQRDESYRQRSAEEKGLIGMIRQLIPEVHGLITKVGEAQAAVGPRYRRARSAWDAVDPAPVEVDIYQKASPLWSYLAHAFRRRNGVTDMDERINAAKLDLLYVAGVAAIVLLGGVGMGRLLG